MSALEEVHRAFGAVPGMEDGASVVLHYGDDTAEAQAVRERAGVVELSHRGLLRLSGADRTRFLQAMSTNDVGACPPGRGVYGALLNDKGRVVSDVTSFADEDALWLDVEAPAREKLPPIFDRYIIMDDVTVADATASRRLVAVHGPAAGALVSAVLGEDVGGLEALAHRHLDGGRVWRRDRVGEQGFELSLDDDERAASLLRALVGAGARPVGTVAMERLRVESGVPRAFHDMDESTLLLEAGMEHVVSRAKGCYLGQEVIVRAQDRGGIRKQLRGLRFDEADAPVPAKGTLVHLGEKECGRITSAARAVMSQGLLALAIVQRDAWELGATVLVGGRQATVSARPFWSRG